MDIFEELPQTFTVEEALSDLPPLEAGQDGSEKEYLNSPSTIYQKLMRGEIDVREYIERIMIKQKVTV